MNSQATPNSISSPASAVGHSPSGLPDGPTIERSAPALARASRSARPESSLAPRTSATFGPSSVTLSRSESLQRRLESRLRANLDVNGSPEYVLTWKHWDMLSGPPICALRGSPRRNSDSGFTGWPTHTVNDSRGGRNRTSGRSNPNSRHHDGVMLVDAVLLHGWPTPRATDGDKGQRTDEGAYREARRRTCGHDLPTTVVLHGWATPTTRAHKDGASIGSVPVNGLLGRQVWAYAETTASGAVLSPAFHLWLQGYPAAWHLSGEAAMQSCRNSPRSSSSRAAKAA